MCQGHRLKTHAIVPGARPLLSACKPRAWTQPFRSTSLTCHPFLKSSWRHWLSKTQQGPRFPAFLFCSQKVRLRSDRKPEVNHNPLAPRPPVNYPSWKALDRKCFQFFVFMTVLRDVYFYREKMFTFKGKILMQTYVVLNLFKNGYLNRLLRTCIMNWLQNNACAISKLLLNSILS